ncbi:MAG: 16S rRNA (adenine(1518)-N(6)/adenine(1519)-N(6))-dimethyltransferase RsmA [Planctomycetaceae bacterium]|jgi:16S rRNA (adenine1518-N6/adenine1519-N6)-dimethyltransferase|nr:16S rRNA (adenine(1518)-N(6)/adenine(1519)-N(6))-dimethyltransferase RsmA [Planctomycetaceae bacterium]
MNPMINQTRSYLTAKFDAMGIRPQSRLGQNFLIDLNLLRLLHASGNIESHDVILEVGTGTGSLTALMSEKAAVVITVEIDPVMQELAKQELFGRKNIRFIKTDILKNKNKLCDEVLEIVREELNKPSFNGEKLRFKLIANLPYCIATPLISNLLLTETPPELMCVTIQKELADRIVAKPRSKDWGALSLWTQAQCNTEIIRIMPPTVFWPRPKVDSAIVRLALDKKRRNKIPDLKFFNEFSRVIFFHRRKFLRAELCSAFKNTIPKSRIDEIMDEMEFDTTTRAETLPLKIMQRLCELCRQELLKLPENKRKIL